MAAAEEELTQIDAKFGDADHGLTMRKIATAIDGAVVASDPDAGIQEMLDDAAMAVMTLNGGSAVPLWNTWLDALQEKAPAAGEADVAQLKEMFAYALTELSDMSGAQVGDKTMMDALIPASDAIAACEGDEAALFRRPRGPPRRGREQPQLRLEVRRAKSYGDKTIGTPDAGAVSMARFFSGLARA